MADEASIKKKAKRRWGCVWITFSVLIVLFLSLGVLLFRQRFEWKESNLLQNARSINLTLFAYAQDHDGKYPEGKTSTEVFQKLIDEGYVSDTPGGASGGEGPGGLDAFYFPMPGKVRPTSKILKPENVCWDVTSGLNSSTPDQIPSVFVTGYKITYTSGASAVPGTWPPRTWRGWFTAEDYPRGFIAVEYKSNAGLVLKADPDGSIPSFIPNKNLVPTQTHHQLTPDGTLP